MLVLNKVAEALLVLRGGPGGYLWEGAPVEELPPGGNPDCLIAKVDGPG